MHTGDRDNQLRPDGSANGVWRKMLRRLSLLVGKRGTKRLALGALAIGLIGLPLLLSNFWTRVLVQAGLGIMMALGLNVLIGYTGLFHLGYASFYAVGAYTYGLLASPLHDVHLPFLLLFPLSGILAFAFGGLVAIPTLPLRGDYLAMVTLAFGEIVRLVLNNLTRITGGPQGILMIDHPRILFFELRTPTDYYYVVLLLCAVEILLMRRLEDSRIGRAWIAVREDEAAARGTGIDANRMKLLACALAAVPGGLAGVLFAGVQTYVSPVSFQFVESLGVVSTIMIGGAGSIPGVISGTLLLNLIAEPLRKYAEAYRMLIYGGLLVLFTLFRPRGLWPKVYKGSELVDEPDDEVTRVLDGSVSSTMSSADPRQETREALTGESKTILAVHNLSKHFGALKALDDVSFEVHEGQILSVIGPNGAGKTTAFNVITGVYPGTSGQTTFDGRDICGLPDYRIARLGIGRTYQNLRVFKNISVLDNVLVGTHCRTRSGTWDAILRTRRARREEKSGRRRALELLRLVGIEKYQGYLAHELSYGHQRRLEIARALATSPKLILLDEPTGGMNSFEKAGMMRLIRSIRDRGVTVVLVEHDMDVVMGISDRIVVLDHGEWLAEGTPAEIQGNRRVVEAYLGRGTEDESSQS